MTRSERSGSGLYEEDFYLWTQQQAAALRALPPDSTIDSANLAEEVEDLGKRDPREVMSDLRRVIQHLVELHAVPGSRDAAHRHAEVVNFQRAARRTFTPGMRRLVEVDDAWAGGRRAAARFLQEAGAPDPSPGPCPFSLDDLLAADFDVATAVERIGADVRLSVAPRQRAASFWPPGAVSWSTEDDRLSVPS